MQMIAEWNQLLNFLAAKEELTLPKYDLAILAGNSLPYLTQACADLYHQGVVNKILLTGGIGHATSKLKSNFQKLGFDFQENMSEAEVNACYLMEAAEIPEEALLLEKTSTNSGENALFSLEILQAEKFIPQQVLLLQDPLLQRRLQATFAKDWQNQPTNFTNCVPVIPKLKAVSEQFIFENQIFNDAWDSDYFINLSLGEIPRLQNDANGYGPNGKDYIVAVEIPEIVLTAFENLQKEYQFQIKR
ncbi:uncharacterized SAM-binding protein YcdF (DUF218 family) [Enterococcus sp. PF1-24]|uniref:YdcF family protein n=1 Tax=unclassified Enterococcus TaxID=2608891 RepID=UPI002474CB67|nr:MULTISPECIES: YdcF family protein [unclassified Enterococcus]MDH6364134.1 uncharacterized SAM-binding protein YcdF (DUF218 family) [Enterococcus sp. PFB1-1]MDH6401235.1 uncharacterized SAM-binding protein YcdF (DUF218 family) [Enterococcus sp. PF1-24]